MYCLRLFFYCCFTRTTLFTTMITVIIFVCSLKSISISCFVLIGYCGSELHAHICPILMNDLRLFIVVIHCLPTI